MRSVSVRASVRVRVRVKVRAWDRVMVPRCHEIVSNYRYIDIYTYTHTYRYTYIHTYMWHT